MAPSRKIEENSTYQLATQNSLSIVILSFEKLHSSRLKEVNPKHKLKLTTVLEV